MKIKNMGIIILSKNVKTVPFIYLTCFPRRKIYVISYPLEI